MDSTETFPEGIIGLIEDGDEVVGVAFEHDFDPSDEQRTEINKFLSEQGLPSLPEEE